MRKHDPFKKIKSTETAPGKDLVTDLLDKNFKMTVLKMLKEKKEVEEKVTKTMFEQNENNNKEIENEKKKKKFWS